MGNSLPPLDDPGVKHLPVLGAWASATLWDSLGGHAGLSRLGGPVFCSFLSAQFHLVTSVINKDDGERAKQAVPASRAQCLRLGASSLTQPHVSHVELPGPDTRPLHVGHLPSLFIPAAPSGLCEPWMWPEADNKPLIRLPTCSTLPFIHSTNICCVSTKSQEVF